MINNTKKSEIKTGAWKEIQISFHNFNVIKDLGMRFPLPESKSKKRYVRVQCTLCGKKYEGQYAIFKSRDKVCKCESRKGKVQIKWSNPARDRILKIRNGMIYRCYEKKCPHYELYGGRGITVYSRWLQHPEEFYNWALGNGYKDGLTIERINNNKGYYPKNCKWITRGEQALNRRSNVTLQESEKIISLLESGVSQRKIAKRINRCTATIRKVIVQKKVQNAKKEQ